MPKNTTETSNCGGYQQCPIEFLMDLLEKLVDSQLKQSESTTDLVNRAESNGEKISWIKSQFTNGFRSEIKEHIAKAAEECCSGMEKYNKANEEKLNSIAETVEQVEAKIQYIRRPRFWVKVAIGIIICVAGATATVIQIYDSWRNKIIEENTKILLLQQNHDNRGGSVHGITNTRPGQ